MQIWAGVPSNLGYDFRQRASDLPYAQINWGGEHMLGSFRLGPCSARSAIAIASLVGAFAASATVASAYDEKVEKICGDDYLAYCGKHAPESAETRYCMEAHRDQLTRQCVSALVEAGLVPKKYRSKKLADSD